LRFFTDRFCWFVTDFSRIEGPPSPSPGTSPWLLDTGASFHMTHDSFLLTSVRPVDPPIRVLTADGTPLPIVSRGLLNTSSFHIPSVAHVPPLNMQLFSSSQIVDFRCSITVDFDSYSVKDHCTAALLGAGPDAMMASGSLTGFVFLPLPPSLVPRHLSAVASSSWTFMWFSPLVFSSSWCSGVCLRKRFFGLSGL
jgi:hypothetical protein